MKKYLSLIVSFLVCSVAFSQIPYVWITNDTGKPDSVVISWISVKGGDSVVNYGTNKNSLKRNFVKNKSPKTLHHVKIPVKKDAVYYYNVETNGQKSPVKSFKSFPSKREEMRMVFVSNIGGGSKRLIEIAELVNPHLIFTCGDNVPCLFLKNQPYTNGTIEPYKRLIGGAKDVFASTIFMPILGNHDKQMIPRGKKRPSKENPVYDVNAASYCKFFQLPSPEWHWQLDFDDLDLTIVGLDTNHISDMGTGWQSCHEVNSNSEQFQWYKDVVDNAKQKFVITLYNESNGGMRRVSKAAWVPLFEKNSLCISGYGSYMEFEKTPSGMFYVNNSLGAGDHYKSKLSVFSERIGGFVLLTLKNGKMKLDLYDRLKKQIVHSVDIPSRPVQAVADTAK